MRGREGEREREGGGETGDGGGGGGGGGIRGMCEVKSLKAAGFMYESLKHHLKLMISPWFVF